ncbi:aminotransferase class IV [Hymenobacter sp. BT730]|uniref:aminotransferase class IV n=1 Tax=Hymenobacter sp. BT730 TaxID=3063332 RepID=UPI0026DEB05A|nr:aminotransferase class IV [Hymenobacter sp. BT730]
MEVSSTPPAVLLYNGQLYTTDSFGLTLPNRGLQFNDGFFETLIWSNDGLRYRTQHLQRMQAAATALELELPFALVAEGALEWALRELVNALRLPEARLRIQVWRSGGGLYTPGNNNVEWLATALPFELRESPVQRAGFGQRVRALYSPVSFCKGPQAVLYVLAAQERARRELDELLLLDTAGHVAEASAAAVFWIRDGRLFTPALSTGCVAGVRRAHLLDLAHAKHLYAHEVLAKPEELLQAEAVFTANVAAIRPLQQIDDALFASDAHPLLQDLRRWEAAVY